ncbi:MAG: MFS transporter [Microbacterium sp.]
MDRPTIRSRIAPALRSFRTRDFRIWAAGAAVSNIGSWMQRTAQDWLVLTQLTDHEAAALGTVIALQFAPEILLLPVSGIAADRWDKRRILLGTQTVMALAALTVGVLAVSGRLDLWHVYVAAVVLGCASAFDAPARMSFVSSLVGRDDVSNAVALNSALFNAARFVGPAIAGVVVDLVDIGSVFLINSVTFAAMLAALVRLPSPPRHPRSRAAPADRTARGWLPAAEHVVHARSAIVMVFAVVFVVGTFGLNFPIFLSTMSLSVFRGGATQYGLFSSALALGSILGAVLAARARRPYVSLLLTATVLFAAGCSAAATAPGWVWFAATLVLTGVAVQLLIATAGSFVQVHTPDRLRGRVTGLYLTAFMGGTPIGAPLAGLVADRLGPRAALLMGACAGALATLIAAGWLLSHPAIATRIEVPAQTRIRTEWEQLHRRLL